MRKYEYCDLVSVFRDCEKFKQILLSKLQSVQDKGYDFDIQYTVVDGSYSALLLGYKAVVNDTNDNGVDDTLETMLNSIMLLIQKNNESSDGMSTLLGNLFVYLQGHISSTGTTDVTTTNALLTQIMQYMQSNNQDNDETKTLLVQIVTFLNGSQTNNNATVQQLLQSIYTYLQNNQTDTLLTRILSELQALRNDNTTNNNAMVTLLNNVIGYLKDAATSNVTVQQLLTNIQNLTQQNGTYNQQANTLLTQIAGYLQTNNTDNASQITLLNNIITYLQQMQVTLGLLSDINAKLAQNSTENTDIKNFLSQLVTYMQQAGNFIYSGNQDLKNTLQTYLSQTNSNTAETNALLNQVLVYLQSNDTSNSTSQALLSDILQYLHDNITAADIQAIKTAVQDSNNIVVGKLDVLTDKLAGMQANMTYGETLMNELLVYAQKDSTSNESMMSALDSLNFAINNINTTANANSIVLQNVLEYVKAIPTIQATTNEIYTLVKGINGGSVDLSGLQEQLDGITANILTISGGITTLQTTLNEVKTYTSEIKPLMHTMQEWVRQVYINNGWRTIPTTI